jgi:hypothetical protein
LIAIAEADPSSVLEDDVAKSGRAAKWTYSAVQATIAISQIDEVAIHE